MSSNLESLGILSANILAVFLIVFVYSVSCNGLVNPLFALNSALAKDLKDDNIVVLLALFLAKSSNNCVELLL